MTATTTPDSAGGDGAKRATAHDAIHPINFTDAGRSPTPFEPYLNDPPTAKLVEFFQRKGLAALKLEDQREQWYQDWLAYQAEHRLYASVMSPAEFSGLGNRFDVLRYARFLEVFGYFSPAHGYSAQVTFLGLWSILTGDNIALKHEAIAALERGELLAFAVSERAHGSDLLGNEFVLAAADSGGFVANGSKYYIGNANVAAIISVLARQEDSTTTGRARRSPAVLFALRPAQSKSYRNVQKIRTLGVRAGFVGAFDVTDHHLTESDVIAQGRRAWDAVFGAITLGKFFLGFGSIGICEHALAEALEHMNSRILYGKPVTAMPHIRARMGQAYARLTAMKLYAYRALDYVHAAREDDRRYQLFCAVQKAKVSTEGVKVMSLLSECVGAKGFEADTYFEMALRDAQLFPGLEGSAHINLALTAQFAARYFEETDDNLVEPPSLLSGDASRQENSYLFNARTGGIQRIAFPPYLAPYQPLEAVSNVRRFVRQIKLFQAFLESQAPDAADDLHLSITIGECVATIAYAQLIAENCARLRIAPEAVSAIFHLLVSDLSKSALALASLAELDELARRRARRIIAVPRASGDDWAYLTTRMQPAP
jgi:acyl-CoA dehydrogenase